MAADTADGQLQLPDFGLKCRQCRTGYLAEIKDDPKSQGFQSTPDRFILNDENLPKWISVKIEEVCSYLVIYVNDGKFIVICTFNFKRLDGPKDA